MAKLKIGKPEDMETRIEDPAILLEVFQQLFDAGTEFPIKVEGTHTLPYFSTLQGLHWDQGHLILKLVRPLPHELLTGAVFQFLCAAGEQRYEGFINYLGREGYLQYRFQKPPYLTLSDRRMRKRYPFRPRESAYVIIQDAAVPGLGVAGPLVNIGLGGMALRVDRIIRLDSGVRIPPATALFDRGKQFPRIRIQELPRVHLLEVRGAAAHAYERGPEVVLGITFLSLQPEEESALQAALEIRDRMQRGQLAVRIEGGPLVLKSGEMGSPATPAAPAGAAKPPDRETGLLKQLRRRTAPVALVMAPGSARDDQEARLTAHGFLRLLVADSLDQLTARVASEPRRHPPRLVLVDLDVVHAGDAEPLLAVRAIETHVAGIGSMPTIILCEDLDPTLLLAQADRTRFLPHALDAEAEAVLDGLLDPQAGEQGNT